jgi:hypothetical protein
MIPWYPLDRRLGGPQSRSGRGGEEKNYQVLPGLEPPIIQPVDQRYTTELSRLLFLPLFSWETDHTDYFPECRNPGYTKHFCDFPKVVTNCVLL